MLLLCVKKRIMLISRGIHVVFLIIFINILPIISYASITKENCLECHEKYTKFKHGKVTCNQCHNDITSLPHDEKLKKPSCDTCHADVVMRYKKSVHREKDIACKNCHDVHFVSKDERGCISCHKDVPHKGIPSTEKHINNISCLACHGKNEGGTILVDIDTGKKDLIKKVDVDPDGNRFLDKLEWSNLQILIRDKHAGKVEVKKHFVITHEDVHQVNRKPVTCIACHNERSVYKDAKVTIKGKQSFSVLADSRIFIPELPSIEDYRHTVHGKKGVKCSDCHKLGGDISDKACIACHSELYSIYKNTVHSERGATKCTDCHKPHHTKSYRELSVLDRLNICVRCHKDYLAKHKWLPNTVLHFRYLECSTCHSPESTKSMVLNFATREAEKTTPLQYSELEKIFGKGVISSNIIDKDRDGVISFNELTAFFDQLRKGHPKEIVIDGSIVVTKVHHDYSEKNIKSKVCANCHSEYAPFYESMLLSFFEGEKVIYIPVKKTVLSAYSSSLFIDMFILGEGKIRPKDIKAIMNVSWKEKQSVINELGFKLIDLIGIAIFFLILFGIAIHILLRMVVKR